MIKYKETKTGLDSELQIDSICSVRILIILEFISKTSLSKNIIAQPCTETPRPIGRGSLKPDIFPEGGELGLSSIKPQVVKLPIKRIRLRNASELSISSVTSSESNNSAKKT